MNTLANGYPSTFHSFIKLATVYFGAESPPVHFLKMVAGNMPFGELAEINTSERDLVTLLALVDKLTFYCADCKGLHAVDEEAEERMNNDPLFGIMIDGAEPASDTEQALVVMPEDHTTFH